MKTAEYEYNIPREAIALRPLEKRDGSRLLVLRRDGGMEHRNFHDLPSFLSAGDMLVTNKSKVFPARLTGYKPSGGRLEILLLRELSPGRWDVMTKGNYSGPLRISPELSAEISQGKTAVFEHSGDLMSLIWKEGEMPLPPYIKRPPETADKERYQTVYAEVQGSIAAPTAGLHFTKSLLEDLAARGVLIRSVTLHVGIGTFRPVKTKDVEDHTMDREFFQIDPDLPEEIARVKASGRKVVAVGTTTTRTLEGYFSGRCTLVSSNGAIAGATDIFIHEGYTAKIVDSLITNFHLPCSTPLMLTAVFAGRERLLKAYNSAISMGYRFFSYGDAMLVL